MVMVPRILLLRPVVRVRVALLVPLARGQVVLVAAHAVVVVGVGPPACGLL